METDVLYALTDDGVSLPVVDVTNPAFAITATEAELAAMKEQFLREANLRREIPEAVRMALQESLLGRGLMAAAGTFLTGMSTYLLKLGPANLGPTAGPIDRGIAASLPAFAGRLRLQDMARLLADALSRTLAAQPGQPVCLINIAGGPAADSWNALIHLHVEHADLLAGRDILVAVLDPDEHGPAFGERALDVLRGDRAPLSGLDVEFRHIPYDWSQADRLREILEEVRAAGSVCAMSSEGGLFEYGSDQEIVSNLEKLHGGTSPDTIVTGSVTKDGELVRATQGANRASTVPRTFEAFASLTGQAGWVVQHTIDRPFSYNLSLVKC